jgi:hypothetical protein
MSAVPMSEPDEPVGWRELVESGVIDASNPQAREAIARYALELMEQGEMNPERLKSEVLKRFGARPS